MNLQDGVTLVGEYIERMKSVYGGVVFDEWAIVSFAQGQGRVLAYRGTRKEKFQQNFAADLDALRSELLNAKHGTGDFEFARHGGGTRFDAFVAVGEELYLIFNNTTQTIQGITQDPRWLGAQVSFAEIAEKFRANPLIA